MIIRIITSLFLFLTVFFSNAQIQRDFDDFKIGVTAKDEFTKLLDERGVKYSENLLTVTIKNVDFYNINWDIIGLSFFNNKLYDVRFVKGGEPEELQPFYNELLAKLKDKYGDYYLPEECNTNKGYFKDKETVMFVEYTKYLKSVALAFTDRNFSKELLQ